jgi:aspartate aminotransferase
MLISSRLQQVPSSPIRKLVPYAVEAKKQGVHVYHLNIGDPDIKTPEVMLDVLRNWQTNPIGYDQSQGNPVFLEAMKTYYHRLGFSFLENTNIQATSGGSEAISMAMFAVAGAGDEILTFEPLYTNYNSYAVVNGVTLRAITTSAENGFHLPSKETIAAAITPKTKAILVCNPNNPTGTVYTYDEMRMLVDIAKEHNVFLLSDEVYREYTYDGKKHVSLLSFMQEIPEAAIVLDSMSKRYSLCGVRIGTLVTLNKDILAGVLAVAQGRLSSGLIDQLVAAKLVDVPQSYLDETFAEYDRRRIALYEGLKQISGVVIPKPEGAFYTIVGLPVADAEDFCKWLLTDFRDANETLMIAPAAGFYSSTSLTTGAPKGKNEVRIAYVLNVESIKRCVEMLKKALEVYKNIEKQKV